MGVWNSFAFFKVWAQRHLLAEDMEFPPQAAACVFAYWLFPATRSPRLSGM